MEIPAALLMQAAGDLGAREAIRVRTKGRRDRMLFQAPRSPLPKHIATAPAPGAMQFGFGRGPGARADGADPAGRLGRMTAVPAAASSTRQPIDPLDHRLERLDGTHADHVPRRLGLEGRLPEGEVGADATGLLPQDHVRVGENVYLATTAR